MDKNKKTCKTIVDLDFQGLPKCLVDVCNGNATGTRDFPCVEQLEAVKPIVDEIASHKKHECFSRVHHTNVTWENQP